MDKRPHRRRAPVLEQLLVDSQQPVSSAGGIDDVGLMARAFTRRPHFPRSVHLPADDFSHISGQRGKDFGSEDTFAAEPPNRGVNGIEALF